MPRKILLAVDNSKNSLRAVQYLAESMKPDAEICVLSIIPDAPAALGLEGQTLMHVFEENKLTLSNVEEAKKAAMEGFVDEAKKTFISAGFPAGNISTKVVKKKVGIARDILKEAEKGKYDTLVVGRRGLSAIKQFVMGSISHKIIQYANNITLLLVE